MIRYFYILLISTVCIACGTQQKVVEKPQKDMTETVQTAIIDSVNAQHDKVALQDSLNTIKPEKPTDAMPTKGDTDGYITDDGVSVTVETVMDDAKKGIFNHNDWHELLQKYVTKAGNVNYKGFKSNRSKLRAYITSLGAHMPTADWSKEEKLAYWINAYNAMTVDLILRNYPLQSIKDIKKPWNQRLWKLGEKWYNLDEIEHKILRKMDEPRIHFAINCASFSCPPLLNEAFTAATLETQLTQVTKVFLADTKRNNITQNRLEISKIFRWFSKDFKQNGSLIDFLNAYTDVSINNKASVHYKEYDWSLNE